MNEENKNQNQETAVDLETTETTETNPQEINQANEKPDENPQAITKPDETPENQALSTL